MFRLLYRIQDFQKWWYGGRPVPRVLQSYFVFHFLIVVFFSILSILDSRHYYVLQGGFIEIITEFVGMFFILIGPIITVGILYLARRGGPSYIALAIADMLLSIAG
jgi:hypothetical protein